MKAKIFLYLKNFDWLMFSSVILLSCFGLLALYSIALGQGEYNFYYLNRQIIFLFLSISLLFIFTFIDWRFLKSLWFYAYLFSILLLSSVLIFGQIIRGTKGWFSIFGFGIQPVEIVKVILILILASYLADLATRVKTIRSLVVSAILTLILIFLVMLQPDFGSALILLFIWLVAVIVSGFKRKYFVIISLVALISSILAWTVFFQDYQKNRILAFLNPSYDVLGSTYNINQSIIAVGSGGLIGQGLGFGSQSQLKFIPEAHTDFIFAVMAEEFGFIGVILIFSLYLLLFARLFKALNIVNNDFGTFFIVSSMGLIFIQMFINIGMNIGIMPVVGLSLPFMSYGGSFMLSLFVLIGIVENIIIKAKINY
jgi:rod shape determining protein RodA